MCTISLTSRKTPGRKEQQDSHIAVRGSEASEFLRGPIRIHTWSLALNLFPEPPVQPLPCSHTLAHTLLDPHTLRHTYSLTLTHVLGPWTLTHGLKAHTCAQTDGHTHEPSSPLYTLANIFSHSHMLPQPPYLTSLTRSLSITHVHTLAHTGWAAPAPFSGPSPPQTPVPTAGRGVSSQVCPF